MTGPRLLLARVEAPAPIGTVHLVSDGRSLLALDFGRPEERLLELLRRRLGDALAFAEAEDPQGFASALRAYFSGRIDALRDLPADGGGTPFQRRVWSALRQIPPGETRSYGELASRLGMPGAARAVGAANARNPVNLVVPCHRVIGGMGALTGYGGGIARKQWLLALERGALAA
jgi:methylated-DNA-[protein]-cysteine S-methyltransferase